MAASITISTLPFLSTSQQAFQVKGYVKSTIPTSYTVKNEGVIKQWSIYCLKPRTVETFLDPFSIGQIIDNVYKQSFSVKLSEIQANQNASLESLINNLQEIGFNHLKFIGLMGDSFGSTPEMIKRNLIWVVTKLHVQVEHYASWGDVLEVNTWMTNHGKNNIRRDWHVRNFKTSKTMMRATSVWAIMHKTTRTLSRFIDEIKEEFKPYCKDNSSILIQKSRKLINLSVEAADYVKCGLTPRWADLDVYVHVNHVKYIGWILESIPISLLETHEITDIVIEYRKECIIGDVVQSLAVLSSPIENSSLGSKIEYDHVLLLDSGPMLLKGRTTWRPKV